MLGDFIMKTIMVVDIGNTSTALALVVGEKILHVEHCHGGVCRKSEIVSLIHEIIGGKTLDGSILSSVVPSNDSVWIRAMEHIVGKKPLLVNHKLKMGISINYPKPSCIGADRLANACGAVAKYGAPIIVADFGTALTFDVVSSDCAYIGGVIVPGLPFMTDYLAERTELLPHIELKGRFGAVGKSTVTAMRLGANIGYRGMVREIVNHVKTGLGYRKIKLCATGGYAGWALKGLDIPFVIDANLTIFGLTRMYQLNEE